LEERRVGTVWEGVVETDVMEMEAEEDPLSETSVDSAVVGASLAVVLSSFDTSMVLPSFALRMANSVISIVSSASFQSMARGAFSRTAAKRFLYRSWYKPFSDSRLQSFFERDSKERKEVLKFRCQHTD
jgi:hypothetical protein